MNKKVVLPFSLSLKLNEKEYKATGKTILEGLNKLLKADGVVKTRGILKVKKGKKSFEMILYPFVLKRLYINKLSRELLQKRIKTIFV